MRKSTNNSLVDKSNSFRSAIRKNINVRKKYKPMKYNFKNTVRSNIKYNFIKKSYFLQKGYIKHIKIGSSQQISESFLGFVLNFVTNPIFDTFLQSALIVRLYLKFSKLLL